MQAAPQQVRVACVRVKPTADSTLAFARHPFNTATQACNQALMRLPTWVIVGMFRFRAASTLCSQPLLIAVRVGSCAALSHVDSSASCSNVRLRICA